MNRFAINRAAINESESLAEQAKKTNVSLFDIEANYVDITSKDSAGNTLHTENVDLRADVIDDWFEYFFAPFEFRRNVIRRIPSITVELDVSINSGGDAKCGHLSVGDEMTIGTTAHGVEVGIQDFSRKERNVFGREILVKRSFSRVIEGEATLADAATLQTLADVRSTPIVWDMNNAGLSEFPELQLFGFYRDFDITEESPAFVDVTFDVRSMT